MKTALIACQFAVLRAAMETRLEALGFDVVAYSNAREALVQFVIEIPDVIFLDDDLHPQGTCAVIREMRSIEGGNMPKIIIIVNAYNMGAVRDLLTAGATTCSVGQTMESFGRTMQRLGFSQ